MNLHVKDISYVHKMSYPISIKNNPLVKFLALYNRYYKMFSFFNINCVYRFLPTNICIFVGIYLYYIFYLYLYIMNICVCVGIGIWYYYTTKYLLKIPEIISFFILPFKDTRKKQLMNLCIHNNTYTHVEYTNTIPTFYVFKIYI